MNYGYPQNYARYYPAATPARQPVNASTPRERFIRGLLIGGAAAYLLTNDTVQRAAIKGAVKAWSTLQGGVEELKERFQDAEAELRLAEQERDS